MTVYQVATHYENYTKPVYQRRIIRILWMVPMYGLCSWFALRFKDAEVFLDTIREFYEAFVIYNFYMFLITFLEEAFGSANNSMFGSLPKYLEETRGEVPHIFPFDKIFNPVSRKNGQTEHVCDLPCAVGNRLESPMVFCVTPKHIHYPCSFTNSAQHPPVAGQQ
mmetsp:Transcript_13535/g.38503  ORF Transcript_13535/g.38503 Transcript_13535/m.38503 type:complete len:165 (+) Transcript_13535:331-825(+)